MTDFVFVKPSHNDPSTLYKCYDSEPRYPFVLAGWEWILERALRRKLILEHLDDDAALAALALRTGGYRLYRWPTYGSLYGSLDNTQFENSYWETYGHPRPHDGTLVAPPYYWRRWLPTGGVSSRDNTLRGSRDEEWVFGITGAVNGIARLWRDHGYGSTWLGEIFFLDPGWSPPGNYRTEASISESTSGSADSAGAWTWTTTVDAHPYELPDAQFFRQLGDQRIDDEPVTVEIEDSSGGTREVTLPKTLHFAISHDYFPDKDGKKVLNQGYCGVNLDRILTYKVKSNMDGVSGSYTSIAAYGAPGNAKDNLGVLPEHVARTPGSPIYTRMDDGDDDRNAGYVAPDIAWGDERAPTWWHANGFPKGLDSVVSGRLGEQLRTLSVTQPAVPPVLPWLTEMPEDGANPAETWDGVYLPDGLAEFGYWPSNHLSLGATPFCAGQMLNALVKTVHRVSALFAVHSAYRKSVNESSRDSDNSWSRTETEVTVSGTSTSAGFVDMLWGTDSDDGDISTSSYWKHTVDGSVATDYTSYTRDWVDTARHTMSDVAILRSDAATHASLRYETKTKTTGSSYVDPSVTTIVNGAESTDQPGDADLMFPDWLRPWVSKAELFLAYETKTVAGAQYTESWTESTSLPASGGGTTSYSDASGAGSRKHTAAKGVVSLGLVDLATGRLQNQIDVTSLRAAIAAPESAGVATSGYSSDSSCVTVTTHTNNPDGGRDETTVTQWRYNHKGLATMYRSSSLYVVVDWKFDDAQDPFGSRPAELDAADEAEAACIRAGAAVRRAASAAAAAAARVNARAADVERASYRAEHADEVKPAAEAEAEAAVAGAEESVREAEAGLAEAEAELAAAVAGGDADAVAAAEAEAEAARGTLERRRASLAAAEETLRRTREDFEALLAEALADAQQALADAQQALADSQQALADAQAAEPAARQAADAAQAAARNAVEGYSGRRR